MKVYYRAVSLLSRVTTLFKVVKLWSMEENIEDSSLLKSVSVEATYKIYKARTYSIFTCLADKLAINL